jgi:hypothetical protein
MHQEKKNIPHSHPHTIPDRTRSIRQEQKPCNILKTMDAFPPLAPLVTDIEQLIRHIANLENCRRYTCCFTELRRISLSVRRYKGEDMRSIESK